MWSICSYNMLVSSGCGYVWQQVSESGVHRPHVAGIHGRENEGAYSIVLSGGYEDDKVRLAPPICHTPVCCNIG